MDFSNRMVNEEKMHIQDMCMRRSKKLSGITILSLLIQIGSRKFICGQQCNSIMTQNFEFQDRSE